MLTRVSGRRRRGQLEQHQGQLRLCRMGGLVPIRLDVDGASALRACSSSGEEVSLRAVTVDPVLRVAVAGGSGKGGAPSHASPLD